MTAAVLHPAEVDAGWLTEVLSGSGAMPTGRVVDSVCEPCGTGQLADSFRFTLTYDPPDSGPGTVVGKFASDDAGAREFGRQSGYYRNEIRFYEQIAATLSIERPHSLYTALADNETDFVLLMDDLSPARIVDQLDGCTLDEAALVAEQAAALHAGSWRHPDLAGEDWLRGTTNSFVQVTDNFPTTVGTFVENFGDLVPESDLAEAAKLNDHLETWKQVFSEPLCLWHSDLRADNLLFDAKDGAEPVAVLDWQGVGFGRGTIDLAYFLGTSLTTEQRRAGERDLVAHYHAALVAAGVDDVTAEQAWDDYRLNAIHGLQTGIFGLGAVKRSARGDELWRVWIARCAAQTRDLDSFAVLAARGRQ